MNLRAEEREADSSLTLGMLSLLSTVTVPICGRTAADVEDMGADIVVETFDAAAAWDKIK